MSLSDNQLLNLSAEAFKRLNTASKRENGNLPAAEAAKTKPSFRLDAGLSRRQHEPSVLSFSVQTKTGAAVETAKAIARKHPSQVEILRRDRTSFEIAELEENDAKILRRHQRPLMIGQCISHVTGADGTLGCFVEVNGEVGLLSASHVLAKSGRIMLPLDPVENYIFQPGCGDRDANAEHVVASLTGELFSIIRASGVNESDGAVARLVSGLEHKVGNVIPKGLGCPHEGKRIQGITRLEDAYEGDVVFKIGHATGYSRGRLKNTAQRVTKIDVPHAGICDFENFVQVRWESGNQLKPFALPGDSGSLYIMEKDMTALAIHVTSFEFRESISWSDGPNKWVEKAFSSPYYSSFGCSMEILQQKFGFEVL